MQSAYDMAKKNYGRTWSKEMLRALVAKDNISLTAEQYFEITGETYVPVIVTSTLQTQVNNLETVVDTMLVGE
jgi:hypothetical protein